MPDWWEHAYGFNPLDASDGNLDPDRDQASNDAEYLAGTDPADAHSILKINAVGIDGQEVWWRFPTTSTRRYVAEAGSSVPSGPWSEIASLSGDGTLREIRHPVSSLPGAGFFRVRCEFVPGE
jgi:hypothetical protein